MHPCKHVASRRWSCRVDAESHESTGKMGAWRKAGFPPRTNARTHEDPYSYCIGLLIPRLDRLEIQRQIPMLQSPLPLHPTETFSMLVSVPGGPVASQCQGNGTPEANLTVFQQFSRTQKI